MEQEAKTVIMPLSEYERMREEVALFRSNINPHEEALKEWKRKYNSLKEQFADYMAKEWDCKVGYIAKIHNLEEEIERLKNKDDKPIMEIRNKKWYEFWK